MLLQGIAKLIFVRVNVILGMCTFFLKFLPIIILALIILLHNSLTSNLVSLHWPSEIFKFRVRALY